MRALVVVCFSLLMPLGEVFAQSDPAAERPGETGVQSTAAPSEAVEEQSGFSRGSVVRSVFTTGIEDREPVDKIQQLDTAHGEVYYFTELRDMSGQTATHRWEYDDKVMAEVTFEVKGPRWRVWSKKSLVPGWTGQWAVMVLNGAGEVISEDVFEYVAQDEAPQPPAETAPATEADADEVPARD